MEPGGDEPFGFRAEDPVNGIFEFKFLKDDQSNYTVCHVVNTDMGLDLKGSKIK